MVGLLAEAAGADATGTATIIGMGFIAVAAMISVAVNIKELFHKPTAEKPISRDEFDKLANKCKEDLDKLAVKVELHSEKLARTVCQEDLKKTVAPLEEKVANLRVSLEEMHRNVTRDLHESISRLVDRMEVSNRALLHDLRAKHDES